MDVHQTNLQLWRQRLEEMKALRAQGLSYYQIGKRFDITGERVRQILDKAAKKEAKEKERA